IRLFSRATPAYYSICPVLEPEMKSQVMNLILPLVFLAFIVLICLVCMFYLKMTTFDQRMQEMALSRDVSEALQDINDNNFNNNKDLMKYIEGAYKRIEALEAGTVEKQVQGPKTPDYLLAELERQLHLKKDASYVPEDEMAAQEKIEEIVGELMGMQQAGKDVIPPLVERIRVSRDPEIRAALIRDVAWRMGPEASPPIMELFRDKEFTSNLRVLAAVAAFKCSGKNRKLLEEFTRHLGDPEEYMVIKTGLVNGIFRDHPFEGAVDILIEGALSPNFPINHRTECLLALGQYDHPKVLRALEEILFRQEEDPYILNFSIQAYHSLMREKSVPFFKRLLDEGRVDQANKAKINEILKKYPQ
ncbi:MAG: hypothetical protein ABIK28_03940, partial [Planctomycetota bacterium]